MLLLLDGEWQICTTHQLVVYNLTNNADHCCINMVGSILQELDALSHQLGRLNFATLDIRLTTYILRDWSNEWHASRFGSGQLNPVVRHGDKTSLLVGYQVAQMLCQTNEIQCWVNIVHGLQIVVTRVSRLDIELSQFNKLGNGKVVLTSERGHHVVHGQCSNGASLRAMSSLFDTEDFSSDCRNNGLEDLCRHD